MAFKRYRIVTAIVIADSVVLHWVTDCKAKGPELQRIHRAMMGREPDRTRSRPKYGAVQQR